VSNTAGALSHDKDRSLLATVEAGTGVTVLPHAIKKPGCGDEIMAYFRAHPETGVTAANQIAVVGDRLTTDMILANTMGGWGLWVREGVVPPEKKSVVSDMGSGTFLLCIFFFVSVYFVIVFSLKTQFARLERRLADSLTARGYEAPLPSSPFE
jgi:phosphatidylglycerophosphatase GEP4